MQLVGKVEGITSDEIAQVNKNIEKYRKEALGAIIDFYATEDKNAQETADRKARNAYRNGISETKRRDGLEEIQAEAQASKQQIADWAKLL